MPTPSGCVPWSTCASCCGSPTSTRFRAHVPIATRVRERHLARFVDEQVVEAAVEVLVRVQPGGAADERRVVAVVPLGDALDVLALVDRLGIAGARALDALDVDPRGLDLVEQLVDRLVARRGDAHALAGGEQARDQPARHPGLAGAGRALDDEVPAVEPEHELGHLVEVGRLDVALERRAAEHRLDRRIAPVAREQRLPDPLERVLLRIRVVGPARDQRPRQRLLGPRRAAPERERPRLAVELDDRPGGAPVLVERVGPDPQLVLLRREPEAVDLRASALLRLAEGLEEADRVGVLDQLLGRLLDPVEERPPDRLALAVVVVEELRGELLPRLEQRLPQLGSLDLRRRRRLRLLWLGERERPELRERLAAEPEQPVAQRERGRAVLLVVGRDRVEDRPVARLDVALVLDDRGAAVLDLRAALEPEEGFHLLEPVAADRCEQAALDDLVEVDEDAAAEQVVDLSSRVPYRPIKRRSAVIS